MPNPIQTGRTKAAREVQPSSTPALPAREEFYTQHVPALWTALVPVFGQLVTYNYIEGGFTDQVQVIVNEGIEGEPRSPGRYTHMLVKDADLERAPLAGDWVEFDYVIYDVVSVNAGLIDVSRLIVQKSQGQ